MVAGFSDDVVGREPLHVAGTLGAGDPTNAAPQAYAGWIVSLAELTDAALSRLDAAVEAGPNYPDTCFFRGKSRLRGRGDATAAPLLPTRVRAVSAAGPPRAQVEALVAELEQRPTTTSEDGSLELRAS